MTTLTAATTPLDFAVHANQLVKEKFEQAGRDHEAITFNLNLQRIAVEYARKGDFTQAFRTCGGISYGFTLIRALMEIGCEMLMAGKEEAALKTIELALENVRNQADGFPEENLLAYLNTIQGFGHTALVHSILDLALSRLEQHVNGCFCLDNYCQLLTHLAIHWRVKAEGLVDYILALPTRIPGTLDEDLHKDPYSEVNMPDAWHDDIDSDTGLLCTMKLLVQCPIFHYGSKQHWGIGDDLDHNDRPRGSRSEEIYNVRHCATFHELFDHMHTPVKHAGRIGRVYTDIIVRHQNGFHIELMGEQAVAVRDEPRIRGEVRYN